jgi:hypothetical protein
MAIAAGPGAEIEHPRRAAFAIVNGMPETAA